MNGIAILRVPAISSERDASSKAIRNLITISNELFENVIVFEEQFNDTEAHVKNINRKTTQNPILSAVFLFLYQVSITYQLYKNREQLDVIFLHAGGFIFVLPIIYCKLSGIPIVVGIIGEPHKGYKNVSSGSIADRIIIRSVIYAEKFAYTVANGLAVFSDDMLTYGLISDYQSKCKRVRFNYESVPDIVPDIESRSNSIVYLGRVCKLKGADRVFRSLELLDKEEERNLTVSFVGDGNLLLPLRQRRDKQELHSVKFTGWVNPDEVNEILRNSKILLLPSRSEGLPKALLEAMAQGTVPVVTSVGNMPSVIEDGTNGVLLEDSSPQAIAETILDLLNSDHLPEMSRNAQNTIRQEYTFKIAKSDFEELINECQENE